MPNKGKLLSTVTLPPEYADGVGECPKGPFPVIVFFSGFATPSFIYKHYAIKLASYGYAVVQYDVGSLTPTADQVELTYLEPLLAYLDSSALANRLNFTKVALAGHSRGGKLAALHLASSSKYVTAYPIDPVDNTLFTPESATYPSAVKALQAVQPPRVAGVAGAGVTSFCNPAESNYRGFYNALGTGSWLQVLPGATHTSFAGIPDIVCGQGSITPQTAIDLTGTAVTAWMESKIRNKSMSGFEQWAAAQPATLMTLTV